MIAASSWIADRCDADLLRERTVFQARRRCRRSRAGPRRRGGRRFRSGLRPSPDGDPVPPPELPADAPVALLGEPVDVALGVALGVNLDRAGGHGVDRLLREAGSTVGVVAHPDEPLVGEVGLDRRLAAVGDADAVGVGSTLTSKPWASRSSTTRAAHLLADAGPRRHRRCRCRCRRGSAG